MSDEILRHLLATIAYRFHSAVGDLDEDFAAFDPGHDARSPARLVAHCVQVLHRARRSFEPGAASPNVRKMDWDALRDALHEELRALDGHLERGDPAHDLDRLRMLQGPFADVLTHIGQLNLLRRLEGSPAPAQSYPRAPVEIGRLGADQGPPVVS